VFDAPLFFRRQEMPVAKQSIPYLAGLGLAAAILGAFIGAWGWAPCLALAGFVGFFFRDPERRPPAGSGLIVAPADGRVISVESRAEGARVAIFLSLFNCHINRSPVAGTIVSAQHTPGRFRPAWDARVDRENERNHLTIRAADGTYGVTQIAGVLARRIVCARQPGDRLERGERFGLIQFGSRTDLTLPPGVTPVVAAGDRVRGGVTVVARAAGAPPGAHA
jgi:phosphatidylserine decarboxylase